MNLKVLIVGTIPYNRMTSSRAFEAYFSFWEKKNLAQIFSNTKKPCRGHCGTLYQITDKRILEAWLHKKSDTGVIYNYDELPEEWTDSNLEVGGGAVNRMYKFGKKHTPFTHILRGILWRKKYWCSDKLNNWLDEFNPDCVFLSFSDDYFISQIALYVACRYNIPIVSSIGDDYYFNIKFSLSPFYYIYKYTYRSLIRKVLAHKGSAIYISDKIRDKYNSEFSLDGETVYLTSEVERKQFAPFNKKSPLITYFGNIRMGRNNSLNEIGIALGQINSRYILHIYSGEVDESYYKIFKKNPNIIYHGSVPYSEVKSQMSKSDMTVVVEGFRKKDILFSRYSLSTKAADALASGSCILAYGSSECGVIEYLKSTEAAAVCTEKDKLNSVIKNLIDDVDLQYSFYKQQIVMTKKHHNIKSSTDTFRAVIKKALDRR